MEVEKEMEEEKLIENMYAQGKVIFEAYNGRYTLGHTILLQAYIDEQTRKNMHCVEVKKSE